MEKSEKKCIVRYETYDEKRINALCGRADITGIVLGDLFCPKRMFNNGMIDCIFFMKEIMRRGKELIYQVPLYVTGRNLEEVRSTAAFMAGEGGGGTAIVQDFGTGRMIRRDYPQIRLVWGRMGRVREHWFSDEFLKFLVENGFYGMETSDIKFAERLLSFGLKPFFGNAVLQYKTVGRKCYVEYQLKTCSPEACRNGFYGMETDDGQYSMTIDGYMLGKNLSWLPADEFEKLCGQYPVIPVYDCR